MKMMNQIEAEKPEPYRHPGEEREPVEFGQPLFIIQ